MKLTEYIKLGFGFFFGYKLGEVVNEIAGETYKILKERIEKGYIE